MAVTRAAAQDERDFTDPIIGKLDNRVTQFLNSVAAGTPSAAFGELLAGSRLLEQEAAVKTLVDKAKEIPDRYGAYRESEQLSAKRLGKDLVLLKYLFKCERFPVIWYFAFYRETSRATNGDDNWVVIAVRFDTQVDTLFD
ncbi:MAG: hypothetical protein AB7O59_17985 [Pirellulales bacterium]